MRLVFAEDGKYIEGEYPCNNENCINITASIQKHRYIGKNRQQLSDHNRICLHEERRGCSEHNVVFKTYHYYKKHYKMEHNGEEPVPVRVFHH